MKKYLTTSIGRLRLLGFLEGTSLLLLVLVGVPLKYFFDNPSVVKSIGPIHGVLFLLFVFIAIIVSFERRWSFLKITWKVLLSCLIPFGTFYIDHTILKDMQDN